MKFTINRQYEIECDDDGVHCGGTRCSQYHKSGGFCHLGNGAYLKLRQGRFVCCRACIDAQKEAERSPHCIEENKQLRDDVKALRKMLDKVDIEISSMYGALGKYEKLKKERGWE